MQKKNKKTTHKVGGDTPMLFYSRKQTDKGVSVVAALHKYAVLPSMLSKATAQNLISS